MNVLERADKELRLLGRGFTTTCYWAGGGWFVSDNRHAVVPTHQGDRHWKVFVHAQPGEISTDLPKLLRENKRAWKTVRGDWSMRGPAAEKCVRLQDPRPGDACAALWFVPPEVRTEPRPTEDGVWFHYAKEV